MFPSLKRQEWCSHIASAPLWGPRKGMVYLPELFPTATGTLRKQVTLNTKLDNFLKYQLKCLIFLFFFERQCECNQKSQMVYLRFQTPILGIPGLPSTFLAQRAHVWVTSDFVPCFEVLGSPRR